MGGGGLPHLARDGFPAAAAAVRTAARRRGTDAKPASSLPSLQQLLLPSPSYFLPSSLLAGRQEGREASTKRHKGEDRIERPIVARPPRPTSIQQSMPAPTVGRSVGRQGQTLVSKQAIARGKHLADALWISPLRFGAAGGRRLFAGEILGKCDTHFSPGSGLAEYIKSIACAKRRPRDNPKGRKR